MAESHRLGVFALLIGVSAGCANAERSSTPDPFPGSAGSRAVGGGPPPTVAREQTPPIEVAPPEPAIDPSSLPPGPVTCDDCGPAPGYPTEDCGDGLHIGGRGPCVQLEDGRCGWIALHCPRRDRRARRCSARECGPAPVPSLFACPDGIETGEFTCVEGTSGRCAWTHRPCRPRSRSR